MQPNDLQYLTDEDIEEIGVPQCQNLAAAVLTLSFMTGGALTRLEKKRLQAAVQAQCGAPPHGQRSLVRPIAAVLQQACQPQLLG